MAIIKVLKIATDGVPLEQAAADDASFASYSVASPSTKGLVATASEIAFDNVVAKERTNVFTTAGDILFPVVTDTAGQVDAFRLPAIAGTPTATPTASGEGFVVWDSTNDLMYVHNGATWTNAFAAAASSAAIITSWTSASTIATRDVVYISAADTVEKAKADVVATSYAIGFAVAGTTVGLPISIQENGNMGGFSGLTAGSRYYLSGATAGAVTATIPSTTGYSIVQCGFAKSTTSMHIAFQELGRRA